MASAGEQISSQQKPININKHGGRSWRYWIAKKTFSVRFSSSSGAYRLNRGLKIKSFGYGLRLCSFLMNVHGKIRIEHPFLDLLPEIIK